MNNYHISHMNSYQLIQLPISPFKHFINSDKLIAQQELKTQAQK